MLALCREHRLEHRTKHIALRYFLARELQQRGQLRLAYVASKANTADIFTKALPPGDHQRFCTMLACFALLCLTGLVTSCSPPLCLWGCWHLREARGKGDPFSPFLFTFTRQLVMAPTMKDLPYLLFLSYTDDTYILGPRERVLAAYDVLQERLEWVGLEVQSHKCKMWERGEVSNLNMGCLGCSGVVLRGRAAPLSRFAPPSRAVPPSRAAPLTEPRRQLSRTALHCTATTAPSATAATVVPVAMASPTFLTFDAEGRAVEFDVWVDDLQLFLQCDSRDGVSLFDHTSGVSTAPAATADSTVRSQWTTRDAVARLAVRSHLPPAEHAHFGQYKTAQSLYDNFVARYSSPATAALSRLMLPYLFPDLAAFAAVADLVAHLRTIDANYRAALPTEDHFLSLCPTELTVDLLEERLAAAEKRILAVGASRGDRRTPFFEGCSPVPLLPSVASAAAADLVGTEEVGAASAPSGRRCNSRGKGSKGGGGGGGGSSGGGGGGGGGTGSGGVHGEGGGSSGSGGGGGGGSGAGRGAATQHRGFGGSQRQQRLRSRETPSVQQLHEWYAGRGRSGGAGPCTYVLRTGTRSGENVAIFDLDFDAILAAMCALADSAEGDYYLSVPPDPGIAATALGANASALSGTAPTESLHTFTLDFGASRSFFRDSTTLKLLNRPVAVSLADPSGGPVLAHSSMVLPCPAARSGLLSGLHLPSFSTKLVSGADLQDAWVDQFTPGGQRVTHCTCSRTGRHLATFTRRPGSSLYTLTTAPPPVSASGQVAASSQVFAAASRWAGSAPLLTPPRSLRLRLLGRLFTWTCGAQPASVDRFTSVTSCWSLTTTRVTPQSSPCTSRIEYAAHQINLQPHVSLPRTTPTLRSTGKVGDVSAFRVLGSRAFVHDTTADKLSSRAVPCVNLGFPPDAPGWQFYHPTSRRVLSTQDVTFDELVLYYRLFPYRTASPPPPRSSS
ncbi:unnamed protein product [Closterium sp. NIES-53]